jgi:hypothetical protein
MATLDQLPAEQRAIVELVVQRGRSYGALADVLQVPADRVRELARDALTELSPRTAARVDPEFRGRIADYLLGQQSASESQSTREHLRRSETSRAWALSLLDSLDPLYANGAQPAIPEPSDEAAEAIAGAPARTGERETEAAAGAPAETVEERVRERERARKPERERERKDKAAAEPKEERKKQPLRKPAAAGVLSPEAQAAMQRRRRRGIGAGLVLVGLVVLVLAITGAFSSDDNKSTASKSGTSTTPATQQPLQVLGQIALKPIGKTKAQGLAYIVQQGGKRFLVVQAQVPPLPQNQKVAAYEVWLYNSNKDARSLGAQYTNAQGVLQGRADLPADFAKFKAVDVSRELFSDKNAGHGNSSVLRGTFASLQPVPQQQQGAAGGAGGQGGASTTPQPTP